MSDNSMTGAFRLTLPKELTEASREAVPKSTPAHLVVEGWRTSWLSKLSELIIGKD